MGIVYWYPYAYMYVWIAYRTPMCIDWVCTFYGYVYRQIGTYMYEYKISNSSLLPNDSDLHNSATRRALYINGHNPFQPFPNTFPFNSLVVATSSSNIAGWPPLWTGTVETIVSSIILVLYNLFTLDVTICFCNLGIKLCVGNVALLCSFDYIFT